MRWPSSGSARTCFGIYEPTNIRPGVRRPQHDRRTSRSASTTWRPLAPSSRRRASSSTARRSTPASATWRSSHDPDGNALMLHHRYAPRRNADRLVRAELLERYQALPLPSTRDEHWRFTDLTGFDPGRVERRAGGGRGGRRRSLDLDVAASRDDRRVGHHVRPAGTRGIRFEALTRRPPAARLARHSPTTSSARTTPRCGSTGSSSTCPPASSSKKPLYLRVASSADRRLALLARPRRRRARLAVHGRPGADVLRSGARGVRERHRRGDRPRRREGGDRQRPAPLARSRGSSPRATPVSSGTPSSTGSRAASARRRARCGSRTTSPTAARRPASPGAYFADGTQHLDYDTYQLHAAPDTTSDFAFKGALRDTAATVWRGMIRVEEGAQKTNAYQENRNLLLSKTATRELDPRSRDPRERRALHPRRDALPGRSRAALLPDGPRPASAPTRSG